MSRKVFSLAEISSVIKNTVSDNFSEPVWIRAEISDISINRNGHCYLELIEKDEKNDRISARLKATIWSNMFRMIRPYFETSTGQTLANGIKILIHSVIEFHEVYGLSLNIIDIDPAYTVGELEMRKQQVINKLKEEGVFDLNRELVIPDFPQKIAVISSESAAGYGDWVNQIKDNKYGFAIYHKLFPSVMQGDNSEISIIKALDNIFRYIDFFDLVIIIRGGGSQSDLNCFNSYQLASHIAQFPLPVLTGIGHERDETISDLVACRKLKTPTAVAEFIIDRLADSENNLVELFNSCFEMIKESVSYEARKFDLLSAKFGNELFDLLNNKKTSLSFLAEKSRLVTSAFMKTMSRELRAINGNIKHTAKTVVHQETNHHYMLIEQIEQVCKKTVTKHSHKLEILNHSIDYLHPETILSRGYSITRSGKKLIKDIDQIKPGDQLSTQYKNGKIKSTVTD